VTGTEATGSFRLAYVPGVTPGKWVRTWSERVPDVPLELIAVAAAEAEGLLREGAVDAGLLRTPIDRSGLHAIALYTETTVVVVPADHEVAGVDEVSVGDLAEYVVLHPLDDRLVWESLPGRPAIERPATTADAVELVAAGIGLLLLPQSLARLHHRKDLTYRPLLDAPQSDVALSWLEEQTTDLVEEFIGIVRGRTANSSRGRTATPDAAQPKQKQSREASGDARKKPASGKSAPRRSQGAKSAKSAKPRRRS
jgi:DNA-binding transcriptional LysR family regulator